jgi:bifunctional non-homologous end joining protein LigD
MLPFQIERIRCSFSSTLEFNQRVGLPKNGRVQPMLATAAEILPRGSDWTYEFKWDGVRALAEVSASAVRLSSRAGNEITAAYPELAGLARGDALVDGEIVAFVDGRPSFGALQERMHVRAKADARRLAERLPVTYMAFDLLRVDGADLTGLPLRERRARLEEWAPAHGVTVSPSFDDGPATEAVARQSGLEGVMAKRLDSHYRPGLRTRDWLKLRFLSTGDFAVVGWEESRDHPGALSSLVLATMTADGPVFAGKVGSGLTGRTAIALQKRLHEQRDCPLPEVPPVSPGGRTVHWVVPEVVVEVKYTLVTTDGRLRQPVFLRVRDDKSVEEATG